MMRATPYWSVKPHGDERIHASEYHTGEQRVDEHFRLLGGLQPGLGRPFGDSDRRPTTGTGRQALTRLPP